MSKTKKKWKENQENMQEDDEINQGKYMTIKLYKWRKQRKKKKIKIHRIYEQEWTKEAQAIKEPMREMGQIENNNQPTKIENNWSGTHNRYKRIRSEQRKRKRYEIRKRRSCSKQSND